MFNNTSPDDWIVSVDDHVIEPPNTWVDRLPAKYRELGPRWVSDDRGEAWVVEDRIRQPIGGAATAGAVWPPESRPSPFAPMRWSDIPEACYDPKARAAAMDADKVQAAVIFANLPGFAGSMFYGVRDKELAMLCIQAYNDWLIDEFAAAIPGRIIPLALVPMWDGHLAAKEAERAIGKGAHAVSIAMSPHDFGFPPIHDEAWDPLYSVVSEANVPLCAHAGTSRGGDTMAHEVDFTKIDEIMKAAGDPARLKELAADPDIAKLLDNMGAVSEKIRQFLGDDTKKRSPRPASMVTGALSGQTTLVEWLNSGNFERFPSLKLAFSEGNIGWIPPVLQAADAMHEMSRDRITNPFDPENNVLLTEEARKLAKESIEARAATAHEMRFPSEVFRDHVYGCFMHDPVGMRHLDLMGEDNIMIETDFPHHGTYWPHTFDKAKEWFADVTDEQRRKVLRGNAERLFNFHPVEPSVPMVDQRG
ncbi:MAG: amidohydrolase family protein [Acidimicrobiales bacterium]